MNNLNNSTPLLIHTLDTLYKELVSGRSIELDDHGKEFHLTSPETRSLFNWYYKNQEKWAKFNKKEDVEALADQLEDDPPEFSVTKIADRTQHKKKFHIKKLKAHRFAGIHNYGTVENPPDDFEFDFDKSLTLIEGTNGSGKTSFLNAITWCLTGSIYRSQREPEKIETLIDLKVSEEEVNDSENILYNMTPITPMPSKDILNSLGVKPLPLDTWVELTLRNDETDEEINVRRSIQRSTRGKIVEDSSDFSKLGLDPIALEIGTKMPGLIPYIQLDKTCDMGKAVSELTGFKPLEDLVEHVKKSQSKLKKELVKNRNEEIEKLEVDYLKARDELEALFKRQPDIDPKKSLPMPEPEKTTEELLDFFNKHFEELQSKCLSESKSILGSTFNPDDPDLRKELIENTGKALGQIDSGSIARLTSAARLHKLGKLTKDEISHANSLIIKLKEEAEELAGLEKKPKQAVRLRLYARIAGWIKENQESPYISKSCPICDTSLEGKTDELTGKLILEHFNHFLEKDSEYIWKTLDVWEKSAFSALTNQLPETLQYEMKNDLPSKPYDLIKSLCKEIFENNSFKGCLSSLKPITLSFCDKLNENIPIFQEPEAIKFPDCFHDDESSICKAVNRISRAIAFSIWRNENNETCKELFTKIIGDENSDIKESKQIQIEKCSLFERLSSLDRMVKNTEPQIEALNELKVMREKLKEIRNKESRIKIYGRTADALSELIGLRDLVKIQVESLIDELSEETIKWKKNLYQSAFGGAPYVENTSVGTEGSINIDAVSNGAKVSALHVSNASDLRATLLAFLIAFWKYFLEKRGGLSLILLDDLQELFDIHNRSRVANSISAIIETDSNVIVTTSDISFWKKIHSSFIEKNDIDKIDFRHIHTLNKNRHHIELTIFSETLEQKRKEFEKSENENSPAQDYIEELRIYLENRLLDFFDTYENNLPKMPTLSDLINAIHARRNKGLEPFNHPAFLALVDEHVFRANSSFLILMNKSHHGKKYEIVYNEVYNVKDDCVRVKKLVDSAHEDYERWLRRDAREIVIVKPEIPESINAPIIDIPLIENLAAFTEGDSFGDLLESEDSISINKLDNHAIYYINSHNFGFAGKFQCRAIVDLNESEIPDNSLVIALYKENVFARRLHLGKQNPQYISLSSDSEDPTKRPESLLLPTYEVKLLKVIGILFDYTPNYIPSSEEAVLENKPKFLNNVKIAYKVKGYSALPLALPGQIILGGETLINDQLETMENNYVAIDSSGGPFLKRISRSIPGAKHVRMFESIGGLGESMLVRTEDVEDSFSSLPLFRTARNVLGVLYEMN
ncbi:AAA family ATPase [Candidatus Latescibacterota bacterium]